tara:strand:+ start:352 stop:1083 length:732 start_codon:yes stop_codon:yes gene_type:complete
MVQTPKAKKWKMIIDIDKCTGCQSCVVACQAENNIPFNTDALFNQKRASEWIRIERYWEGEFPNVKAKFMPVLCQHCNNAPCEPVCPVYAAYHNDQGMNVQVYNRCIGTRFCQNNCPYHARFFNWFDPYWPEEMKNQLNPDVTVRSRGIMEKCTFCVQRIRRAEIEAGKENRENVDGDVNPACVQSCPSGALMFGDSLDPDSQISKELDHARKHLLLDHLGTEPNVIYLKKVDPDYVDKGGHH